MNKLLENVGVVSEEGVDGIRGDLERRRSKEVEGGRGNDEGGVYGKGQRASV